MAGGSRVGMMLRQRREQLGISLERAARDTNVRSRILEIIEAGDFGNFPPHGHAIGIISSYARYLDLDPRPLLEEFDSEYQAFRVSSEISASADRTRSGLGRFGERISASKSRPLSREASDPIDRRRRGDDATQGTSTVNRSLKDERAAEEDERYRTGSVKVVGTRQTGSLRSSTGLSHGATGRRTSHGTRDASRSYHAPAGLSNAHYTSVRDRQWREEHPEDRGISEPSGRLSSSSRMRQATGSSRRSSRLTGESAPTGATGSARMRSSSNESTSPNFFGIEVEADETDARQGSRRRSRRSRRSATSDDSAQPRADENIFERLSRILKSVFSERRTRLIAAAFAVIVIGVIIAASILISTAGRSDSGLIEVQGGAVNDTTTTDDGNAAHKTITTANGNPITIKIEVASGETSLISITYDGGNPYSGTAVGPFTREFPVTESFSATFGNPDAVTVSENGNPIDIAKNADGTGSLSINVQAAGSSSAQISQ